MVEVEERGLRAFEEHRVAARPISRCRTSETSVMRARCRSPKAVRSATTASQSTSGVGAAASQHACSKWRRASSSASGERSRAAAGRPCGCRGGRPCPRRRGRCRAAWCRSCARRARSSDSASRPAVVRQDQVRAVRDHEVARRPRRRCSRSSPISLLEAPTGSIDHPVAHHAQDPGVQDPGGNQVQHEACRRP